ncbi:MAG: GNAT family N-acetyltransferase [Bacteroidota bacterium]
MSLPIIRYEFPNSSLEIGSFLHLVASVWPSEYDAKRAAAALAQTSNFSAWSGDQLVGCVRLLTDGYFFSTITEILVHPDFQGRDIGRKLMEMAWEASPSSLGFGVQPGKEGFFEKLGFEKGLSFYQKRKSRN